MYNIIRHDELTGPEVIDSTEDSDEAQWMRHVAARGEPGTCFYIREESEYLDD